MKRYYECHITIQHEPGVVTAAEPNKMTLTRVLAEIENVGWVPSYIEGDPDLGPGVKCYATRHFNIRRVAQGVVDELETVAADLARRGCHIKRKKVELVVYDSIRGRDLK